MDWAISPGTMGLVGFLIDVLGIGHIDPGNWPGPVFVIDTKEEDVQAAVEIGQ